jgi:Cadherin-like beta sandwich domain/PASTA domain
MSIRFLRAHARVFLAVLFVAGLAGALTTAPTARAAGVAGSDFELFTTGSVNGQGGWTSGHGSSFCPVYDEGVVANTYGYPTFGAKSLRISNAIGCGSYNDQTFSPSLTDEAGETSASTSVYSGGTRHPYFEAQWDFASTVPGSEQPGLSVVASADRGDPSRMTWLQMQDTPSGLQLNFEDYQESIQNFVVTPIATGLDRTVAHTVKVSIQFVDGPTNDVVDVYLDGSLVHTGTTWEDYYRDWAGGLPAPVDSMMFRVSAAAPANSGNGFLLDNFSSFSGPAPTADLAGLSLSNATLSPAFDPSTTAYSTTVGNAITTLGLSANANVGAHVVVSGASTLAVGSNTVTIAVTTDDGLTTKTYTVTVIRAAPPAPTPVTPASPPVSPASPPATPVSSQATSPSTSPPVSPQVAGVPDLIGLTADQARALAISSGFKIGTVTEKSSNEPTNTVIGQDPWPLPAYLPAGAAIDLVVSLRETASAPLIVRVAASRRIPIAIRHAFTPLVLTTIGAKATITLTSYRNVTKTYLRWSRTLKSGANYLTLKIPRRLKITLPGNYRLTFDVQSEGQSKRYSVRMRLSSRVLRAPLPTREADVLLVSGSSISGTIAKRLSARYSVMTVDSQSVFTATHAPNERVGAVVLDAKRGGLITIRHLRHTFPDLRIVAVVSSPAAGKAARAAGASLSIVNPSSAGGLGARVMRALEGTLGE